MGRIFGNSPIGISFTYHIIHPFKAHDSMFFSILIHLIHGETVMNMFWLIPCNKWRNFKYVHQFCFSGEGWHIRLWQFHGHFYYQLKCIFFECLFMHSFHVYLWSSYYVPHVPDTENTVVKTKSLCSRSSYSNKVRC